MSVWLPIVIVLGSIAAILLWATIAGRNDPKWVAGEEDEYITGAVTEEEDDGA